MAIGASVGSVATGRTATNPKPFFSSTRRAAASAASGAVNAPVPLAPTDRITSPGYGQHDRWPGAGPVDTAPIRGDLLLCRGLRCPPAGHARQAQPPLDGREVLGHAAQGQHPVTRVATAQAAASPLSPACSCSSGDRRRRSCLGRRTGQLLPCGEAGATLRGSRGLPGARGR
jgi:hypothetical protein